MRILLQGGTIINEGEPSKGDLFDSQRSYRENHRRRIDSFPGTSKLSMPRGNTSYRGVIDDQVHFRVTWPHAQRRHPKLKRMAAAGGVTSFMDYA